MSARSYMHGGYLRVEAGRIVADVTGSTVEAIDEIHHGVMTWKFKVQVSSGEHFIVRFYPPGREAVLKCEPGLMARCRAAGLPAPVVVADSRNGPRATLTYVTYRMLPGDRLSVRLPLLHATQTARLIQEVAATLAAVCRIEVEGFGELVDSTHAQHVSWAHFVSGSLRRGLAALGQNAGFPVDTLAAVRRAIGRVAVPVLAGRSSLVWGDVNLDNILVDASGGLTGLVDFESCLAGDPIAVLGYCLASTGPGPFMNALLASWPDGLEESDMARIHLYAVLRALRLAEYAHLPTPNGHPRDPLPVIFPGFLSSVDALAGRIPAYHPE